MAVCHMACDNSCANSNRHNKTHGSSLKEHMFIV